MRATCSPSARSSPGGGAPVSRTWKSRSKSGSSIQYGWSSPNGTSTSRQRNGRSRCRRSPTSLQRSFAVSDPVAVVDGSRIARPPTCPYVLGDSIARNCASRLVSCRISPLRRLRLCPDSGHLPEGRRGLHAAAAEVVAHRAVARHLLVRDELRPDPRVGLDRLLDLAPLVRRLRVDQALGVAPRALAPPLDHLLRPDLVERERLHVDPREDRVVVGGVVVLEAV